MAKRGRPGPRPHVWVSGPDPQVHRQRTAWARARAQAQWRGEGWEITWPQYQEIWGDLWQRRGRTRHSLCLARPDYDLPWCVTNVEIITRQEHARRQGRARHST